MKGKTPIRKAAAKSGTKPVLFVHSAGPQGTHEGSSDFVSHLRKALGAGYEVSCPEMPDPGNPAYAGWKNRLGEILSGSKDDTILVGHSLGGSVLLKFLSEEKHDKPIAGLFLVATPFWGKDRNWRVEEFQLREDFPSTLPRIPRIVLYHSRDDDGVPFAHLKHYAAALAGAEVRELDGYGHVFPRGLPELAEDIQGLRP